MDKLKNSREAALLLNVSVQTLAYWRHKGKGPKYIKLSDGDQGHVRYRLSDIQEFIESMS